MNKKILESTATGLAYRVKFDANNKAKAEGYSIDVLTIITIVNIIIKLVEIFIKWFNGRDKAASEFRSLNPLKRFMIWFQVKKQIRNRREARYVYRSMCDLVYNLKEEEVKRLFQTNR